MFTLRMPRANVPTCMWTHLTRVKKTLPTQTSGRFCQWDAPGRVAPQARSQGGVGGVVRPPPVAHPKDFVPPFSNFVPPFSNFVPPFSNFVPPFSNFVPPFSNFVPPFSNFVPPFSNFVPPFSNFVPPFSNFVPPLEYVDDVTRAMSKGGVLVNVQEWGRFSNWWRHADNVQGGGGGCAWCSTHPSSDPPPTWLAGYGPAPGHQCEPSRYEL